jgi:hypothetical protein
MRCRGALHRLPAHGTRRRQRGGALDAGHAAAAGRLTTALLPWSDKAMMIILSIIIADES